MMLQFNKTSHLLVSIRAIKNVPCIKYIEMRQGLYFYLIENIGMIDELLQVGYKEKIIYYLDSFVILLPDEYDEQNNLWRNFYKVFGSCYEKMIDVSHNKKCIEGMVAYINSVIGINSSSRILDYGCGSGLSASISTKGKIIGYDPIYEMRMQACQKGLQTLDTKQMKIIPNCYFDAIFSSYVFHMAVSEDSIEEILPKMKPGAIWIANYYKGINESYVNNFFLNHDFQIIKVNDMQERFGNVYEYRKRSDANLLE